MEKVQKKLTEASNTIEEVSIRRRAIDRRLRGVEGLSEAQATALLQIPVIGSDVAADEIIVPDLTVS